MRRVKDKYPQKLKEQVVKRYLAGEDARSLARENKVSVAGVYLWIKKARNEKAQAMARQDMTPEDLRRESLDELRQRVQVLTTENDRLKRVVFEYMVQAGKI